MAELRKVLEGHGFDNVSRYIASGNVFLDSDVNASKVADRIEAAQRVIIVMRGCQKPEPRSLPDGPFQHPLPARRRR